MRILTLDLGTRTGWALWDSESNEAECGTWVLDKGKDRDQWNDARFSSLEAHLHAVGPVQAVVVEDVQFVRSQKQAHLWGGLRAVVSLCFEKIPLFKVPVATLKRFATGAGNAEKPDMVKAAKREVKKRGWKCVVSDDNAADALLLLCFWLDYTAKARGSYASRVD